MGDLIRRREKPTPVQPHRIEPAGAVPPPPPVVVQVPGPGFNRPAADPPPPATHNSNVVYVVAPQQPTGAAPPPREVHHHHYHTTTVAVPVYRRPRVSKGTSFLGTLAFVVGGLACLTAFVPQPDLAGYARPIAEAGLGMAALAWVGAVLLRRVGAGMPLLGMAVSAAGYGLWLYNTGQAQRTYDHLRKESPVPLPAVKLPAPPPSRTTPSPLPVNPTTPSDNRGASIFDPDSPGWQKSAASGR